jgi:hypothetical protein
VELIKMQRKPTDKTDSKGSFPQSGEREEDDLQLFGNEIREALKNLGPDGEEFRTPSTEMNFSKKEEKKPARIEVVKLDDKSAKKEAVKEDRAGPNKEEVETQQVSAMKGEEEPLDKLVKKVDEVYGTLDELSRSMTQLNKDLRKQIELISPEMEKFIANLKEASGILERVKGEAQGAPPSTQLGKTSERAPTFAAPRQQQPPPLPQSYQPPPQQGYQPPPQQAYQPSSYGYQSPSPQQPQYYSQQPYAQQPPPPPTSPGLSPEEAVARGVEMLRGTVFSDVISSLDQVASIIFSRLLDAREKILRMEPQFPLQEFEPVLSELRANPRMKLSNVDKRKLVDKMVNWSNRLPRPP